MFPIILLKDFLAGLLELSIILIKFSGETVEIYYPELNRRFSPLNGIHMRFSGDLEMIRVHMFSVKGGKL